MSEVVNPLAPPPGSTIVGDLYADLQSRTLWLGVDPAVDVSGAVLISDIATLQANITQCLADSKAYTNTQISTRAPTVHTHTSGQITDFNAAVSSIVNAMPTTGIVSGTVQTWAGDPTVIGTGAMATWLKCDGASLLRASYPELFAAIGVRFGSVDGTHFNVPNLYDRFVIGAGNTKAQGAANSGSATVNTNQAGSHTHVIGSTTLTAAQMPSHNHGAAGLSAGGSGGGYTDAQGNHAHGGVADRTDQHIQTGNWASWGAADGATDAAGNHAHNVAINSLSLWVGGATDYAGSDSGHTHTIDTTGVHAHTLTSQDLRDVVPYLALTYIIKT